MVITKREAKQASKKLLSVLLAVVMLMTSMSVCFGSIAFAAGKDVSVTALANTLKYDSIKNASFTGSANDYTVSDPDGKILAAVEAYYAVVDAMANKNPVSPTPSSGTTDISQNGESTDKTYRTINQLNARVKTLLKNEMGADYTAYNVDGFITGLLAGASISDGTQSTSKEYETTNNTTVLSTPLSPAPEAKLTVVMESAVTGYTLDNLPENVITSKTFTVKHENTNYDYAYDYTKKTNGFFGIGAKPAKFKHTFYYYYNLESVTSVNGASISTGVIHSAAETFEANKAYFAMDLDSLVAADSATLSSVSTAVTAAKNSVVDAFSDFVYTHFFSAYDADALVRNIALANEINALKPTLMELYNDVQAGYDSIITDKNALTTLSQSVKVGIDAYNAASDGAKAYATEKGFVIADAVDFYNAILHEIDLIEIRELTDRIIEVVAPYLFFNEDQIDDDQLTSATLTAAISQVNAFIGELNTYKDEDVIEIAGSDFKEGLTELKAKLDSLKETAEYNEEFAAEYIKFADEIFSVTDANGDTDVLFENLNKYDGWYSGLKSLINSMKADLGEELAEKLFDDLNDVMTERMDAAYVALNVAVEEQIDAAYLLFNAYISTYGEDVNFKSISAYNAMKASIGLINVDAYNFLKNSPNFNISADAVDKYNALQKQFPDFDVFISSMGFSEFETSEIENIIRLDSTDDIARKNENGEYVVDDAKLNNVIGQIDALLNNAEIKELLGTLINKDENGNPTGEELDIANLLTSLIKDNLFTDSFINTVVGMLYPLVTTEFIKVWANDLPPSFHLDTIVIVDLGFLGKIQVPGQDANISYDKNLHTVLKESPLEIFPDLLASVLDSAKYADNIALLRQAQNQFRSEFGASDNNFYTLKDDPEGGTNASNQPKKIADKTPWDSAALKKAVLDENGYPVIDDATGEAKTEWALSWGVDDARAKLENGEMTQAEFDNFFYQAFDDAVEGLKPLLYALIANTEWTNTPVEDLASLVVKGITILGDVDVTVDLTLSATANKGYANLLVPVYEVLGTTFKAPSVVEGYSNNANGAADILKAILDPVFAFIDTLGANPLDTLLGILPDICFVLATQSVPKLLDMLKTTITYFGKPIGTGLPLIGELDLSTVSAQAKVEGGADISVGSMLDLEDMGVDLSDGINTLLKGFGMDIPQIDQGLIATLGELTTIDTQRSDWIYTKPADGKAYHIEANKADVLAYIIDYALGSGLLNTFIENPEGFVADLLTSLGENPDDVVAAVVELLNMGEYDTLREFEWYNGFINDESVLGNSAYEIYLNPENDWTKEKAEFLYNNIDSLLKSILTLAGAEFDLAALINDGIGGLLTNETLTALAKLLGGLDLNALLAGEETEGEQAAAPAIDINSLVKELLGIDLSAYAQYKDLAEDTVVDFGVTDKATFVVALTELLEPLSPVLDFLLAGENLTITLSEEETIELIGYDGYNNAIIPLLEALGCDVKASVEVDNKLEAILNALVSRIDSLTQGDVIKNIIDLLPGALYYIASKGLSVSVRNLLQPVYVILDIIRPIVDLDLNELINGLLPEEFDLMLNIDDIGVDFIFDLLGNLIPDLDISALKDVIYDICFETAAEYTSVSTLQTEWKKGAYSNAFDQADMLTVILSFVLEWATVKDNAEKLDELLKTDGIISALGKVFEDVEIAYGTPDWMYWFETEEEFNNYVNGNTELPDSLLALTYPNDWSEESAEYIADNLASLVDMVIGLIEIDGIKYDSLSALVNAKLDVFNAETINSIVGLITGLLAEVDDNLLGVGYLLDVDLTGLKNYTCTAEINGVEAFAAELANILNTYAKGLVDWLFFGDDFRFAKKSDNTDTIVINGGLGYEKGLALVLEALGCELPETATTESVLLSLANRIDEILGENMVNEVIDLLPNLVYFLNADGASVAVNNLLAPVYALLAKLEALNIKLDLAELLGFDLKYLSLDDILTLVKDKTGLNLDPAKEILVELCLGKIVKADYTYKMVAERKDTVTLVLTTALLLVKDADFAAKLEEMLGTDMISAIKTVFESAPVTYKAPEWYALDENDIDYDNATVGVIKYAIEYPNNWTQESAQYISDNLGNIGDMVASLIDSNYTSLGALASDKINIYTPELLQSLQNLLGDLIAGLDEDLKELVNVGLGAADKLLGADVQGLLSYDVSGVNDKDSFVAALTGMLMEVEGLVDWLLFGESYELFVDDKNVNGAYDEGEAIITLNGGHGYAEGLALVLETLGVENLPDVYAEDEINTEAAVSGVLNALFTRFEEILANPVIEIVDILPGVLYFINANGLTVAVENLLGAINALLIKLEGLGLVVNIAELINIEELLGVEKDLKIGLDNLSVEAIIELVAELTGLNLDNVADVLDGFALGRVSAYESVSKEIAYKMYYHDDFAKYDMITVIATVAIITLTNDANAEKVKGLLGEDIYQVVLNLCNMNEVPVQEFDWKFTDKADTGYAFSAIETSDMYEGKKYGPLYTEEMAQYISENIGDFIDNLIYLLGIQIDGQNVDGLKDLINGLLNGSLYNSENIVAIRDALAGVLAGIETLEVNGQVVGGHIAEILKSAKIADIKAVADVKIPEFTEDRAKFTEYLCKVLEPLYPVLTWILADEDIGFFVNEEKTDAISLKGAEGYAYGIVPLLETLECEGIIAPEAYYAAVRADGNVVITSIIDPLLNRVDEILADDPAEEILAMLPNLIYFINSNGVDTVVKNALNSVFTLLSAIEPIAKIDLYEIIGFDLSTLNFEKLFDMLLDLIADATGYEFDALDINAISELTVGTLVSYTSLNGNTAYKMIYQAEGAKNEMVTVVMRLIVTFIMHENNRDMLIGLLKDNLNMSADAEKFVVGVLNAIATVSTETYLGMDQALATIYYLFYGADIGVDSAAGGLKDINKEWQEILKELGKSDDPDELTIGNFLASFLDKYMEDVFTSDGIAPNGFIAFFQKIIDWFNKIVEWIKNLF